MGSHGKVWCCRCICVLFGEGFVVFFFPFFFLQEQENELPDLHFTKRVEKSHSEHDEQLQSPR